MKIGDKATFPSGDESVAGEVYDVSETLGLYWIVGTTKAGAEVRVGLPLPKDGPKVANGMDGKAREDASGEEGQ